MKKQLSSPAEEQLDRSVGELADALANLFLVGWGVFATGVGAISWYFGAIGPVLPSLTFFVTMFPLVRFIRAIHSLKIG